MSKRGPNTHIGRLTIMRKIPDIPMITHTIVISDELQKRLRDHSRNNEMYEEIITRLLDYYEEHNTKSYTYD